MLAGFIDLIIRKHNGMSNFKNETKLHAGTDLQFRNTEFRSQIVINFGNLLMDQRQRRNCTCAEMNAQQCVHAQNTDANAPACSNAGIFSSCEFVF